MAAVPTYLTYPTSHPSIYFMSFTAEIDMNEDENLIAPKSILGTAMTAGKISIIDGSAERSRRSAHWMCVMSVVSGSLLSCRAHARRRSNGKEGGIVTGVLINAPMYWLGLKRFWWLWTYEKINFVLALTTSLDTPVGTWPNGRKRSNRLETRK